jgi:hypothetical protein
MKFSKGIGNSGYGAFGHVELYSVGSSYTRDYDSFLTSPPKFDILKI